MDKDEAIGILLEVIREEMRSGRLILSGRQWGAYDFLRQEYPR